MKNYEITNPTSGVNLGTYQGETPEEALDAMARDAGYADAAEAAEVAGKIDLTVTEITA